MNVDGSISSVIQGVSEQSPRERLDGQCELQENLSSDPVEGIVPRPNTNFIETLFSDEEEWYFSEYDDKSAGRLIIATRDEEIKVFDATGQEYTVTVESGAETYLTNAPLKVAGVDDTIYALNKEVVTATLPDLTAFYTDGAIVHCLGGQYGRTYKLDFTWYSAANAKSTASCQIITPDGSSSSHIKDISTEEIIADFVGAGSASNSTITNNFTSTGALTAVFDYIRKDDVLFFKPKVGADVKMFFITAVDGDASAKLKATNRSVSEVADLPQYAPQGYHVKIEGNGDASEDDWYVQFVCDLDSAGVAPAVGAGFGTPGSWVECAADGIEYKLDPETMPHVLERTGALTMTFKEGVWRDREVGDDDTNAMPSFVGFPLEDIGVFQGRLVVVSDVNAVMSRTNKTNNFFRQSATTLADTDPIDMSSALGKFRLYTITPHNRDLVIFSEKAQFIVFGRAALTPQNASLVLTTEFEADLQAKPVSAGRNVIFSYRYGNFVGVQEFYTEGSEDANNSRPITQHVPKYIPGRAVQLVSTTNFSKLVVRTEDPYKLRIYEYIWAGNEKVQASWSTWIFTQEIKHCFFDNNRMYMVVFDGSDYILQYLDLDIVPDTGVNYRVCLDNKAVYPNVGTTINVPFDTGTVDDYVAVQGMGCPYPGLTIPIVSIVDGVVTLAENAGMGEVILGKKYLRRWIPTMPMVKDANNVKVSKGSLSIKNFTVYFNDTGYFNTLTTDKYGYSKEVEYNARIVADPENVLGVAPIISGQAVIPFKKDADKGKFEINSDSHLPASIIELGWSGQYKKLGKRITSGG